MVSHGFLGYNEPTMFSKKPLTKSVMRIDNNSISYITLSKSDNGFFVKEYESFDLVPGIIVDGEVLKADVLTKIFKKMAKKIENKNIDIILPHENFFFAHDVLNDGNKTLPLKKRIKNYFQNNAHPQPWHTTHICEFSTHLCQGKEKVLFTCLPDTLQKGYVHLVENAGLEIGSLTSDMLAFNHLLGDKQVSLVGFSGHDVDVVNFSAGACSSSCKVDISYQKLVSDITKYVKIDPAQARDILTSHGVLRSHKNERVYMQLLRSIAPLVDELRKGKVKDLSQIIVVFRDHPIPGLPGYLAKVLGSDVQELDVIYNGKYVFQEVLNLHRNDSYQYQSHIAQALKSWNQ